MKKLFNFFRKKITLTQGTQEVKLTHESQPHVLQTRTLQQGIQHGSLVNVNLDRVTFARTNEEGQISGSGELTMFFCPLGRVTVNEIISSGDGGRMPEKVSLHNFRVPAGFETGVYSMKNVLLLGNGSLHLMTTQQTILEKIDTSI